MQDFSYRSNLLENKFYEVRDNKRGGGVANYIKEKLNGRMYGTNLMVSDDVLE